MAPKPQEHLDAEASVATSIMSIQAEAEERQRVEDAKSLPILTTTSDDSEQTTNKQPSSRSVDHPPTTNTTAATTSTSTSHESSYYYLSPPAAKALPEFQYDGTDLSLLYKYVLSPLAQYLVDNWTPDAAAPNTITLVGLCWMVTSYVLIWYHCPDMDGEGTTNTNTVPQWIFGFNALAMLIYQTLDNMDGKQSRRTKSSSPLGLLFDHGCDSINSIFGSVNWICAMGLSVASDQWQIAVLVLCPMVAFYVTTWEEYYTHKLVLPIVNGPSDGLLMGATLFAVSALWGVEYWQTRTWFEGVVGPYLVPFLPASVSDLVPAEGMRNCDVVAVLTLLALGREAVAKVFTVARRYGLSSTAGLFPMVYLCVVPAVIGYSDPTILARHPRTCFHLIAALFVESVTQLMFDHMTTMKFRSVRPALVPLAIYAALVWTGTVEGRLADDLLISYTAGMCVYQAIKFKIVIHEICDLLGIWCFDIITPHPKGAAARRKEEKVEKVE